MKPNERAALDAGQSLCLHIGRLGPARVSAGRSTK
jgi:hypothetical protein